MSKKKLPSSTKERATYFASGRVTVGTLSTYQKSTHRFIDWFVGKVRGHIIVGPQGNFKFKSHSAALAAAEWYRRHARRAAEAA